MNEFGLFNETILIATIFSSKFESFGREIASKTSEKYPLPII